MSDFTPINYAGMQNTPDPFEAFGNGFKAGDLINQARDRDNAQTLADAQQAQMNADLKAAHDNPNSQNVMKLLQYPALKEFGTAAMAHLDDTQKKNYIDTGSKFLYAAQTGHPEIAQQVLQDRIDAANNSGDKQSATDWQNWSDMYKNNPADPVLLSHLILASSDPKTYQQTLTSLNTDKRTEDLHPGLVTKGSNEANASGSIANKAASEAITAATTAQNAPDTQAAELLAKQSDATIKQTEAKNKQAMIDADIADKNASAAKKNGGNDDPLKIGAIMDSGLQGDELLKSLPQSLAAQVKAYADGRRAFPSGMASRSPAIQQMLNLVAQYDPAFDQADFNKRNRTATAFASGKEAAQIKQANQAINHMGTLYDDINALGNFNGVASLANPIVNFVQEKTGDVRQGKLRLDILAVTKELEKAFAGSSGGNLTEFHAWKDSLPENASREQQQAYLLKGVDLLHDGVIGSLEQQYQNGMGTSRSIFKDGFISKKSQDTLNKIQGNPANNLASEPTAPNVNHSKEMVMQAAKSAGLNETQTAAFLKAKGF